MSSFILLTIIIIVLSAIKYMKIKFNYVENLWKLIMGNKFLPELVKEMYDAHPNLPLISVPFINKPLIILKDLKNIQAVLHGNFESFYARDFPTNTTDTLSHNLFFVDDFRRWKLIRQKFAPVLSNSMLKNMFYITDRCARDFVKLIDESANFDINPYDKIYTYTASSIGSIVFGINERTYSTMKASVSKIAYQIQPTVKLKLQYMLVKFFPKLYRLLNLKISGTFEETFIEMLDKEMKERRINKEIKHDFIDVCLDLEDEGLLRDNFTGYELDISLKFLAAQAFAYFFGGIDTVSTVLHFTLLELSNNKEILQKVHDEIDKIFENNEGKLRFKDLDKLEYTKMVLNESMRKYPPIGVVHRKCCKDTILPIGNFLIKKETNIVIPIFGLHRDSKYFPNPDVFDPERFSAENASKIVKYSFMPFGEGKRICIGIGLAMMEMKTCLAWLLHNYTLQEQSYTPMQFDSSAFVPRDPNIRYRLIPRSKS